MKKIRRTIMKRSLVAKLRSARYLAGLFGAALGTACAAPAGEARDEAASFPERTVPAPHTSAEVLHELDLNGVRYRWLDAGEPNAPSVILHELGPARTTPLERLMAEYPALTMLEVFLALTSGQEAPPEQLIESHAVEASLIGRELAVRYVDFDPSVEIVEKSANTCKTHVLGALANYWTGSAVTNVRQATGDNIFTTTSATAGTNNTTMAVAVATCNDSTESIYATFETKTSGDWVVFLPAHSLAGQTKESISMGFTTYTKNARSHGASMWPNKNFFAAGARALVD
jgi:hypothetical protein